jgi:nicotinic acid mononucleotide adenylyltransferase
MADSACKVVTKGRYPGSTRRSELNLPERPYTVETLDRLKGSLQDTRIFFVMGADSWMDIKRWHQNKKW